MALHAFLSSIVVKTFKTVRDTGKDLERELLT